MRKKIGIFIIMFSICIGFMWIILNSCIEKKVYYNNNKKYLTYNMSALPKDLLLLNNNSIREQDLNISLFEGLVVCGKGGDELPGLASSWKISKDKLTYTFNIREDARWSSGEKITAKDFEEFFERILKEKNNDYREQLQCVFGVNDYIDSNAPFSKVAIKAPKKNILEIKLNYPCEDFLKILDHPVFALKKNFYNLRNWKDEYKKIDYSGAFIIEKIDNQGITIVKNKNYWDKHNIISEKIYIKNKETTAFAAADYNSNNIDIFPNYDIGELNDIPKGEKLQKTLKNKRVSLNFNLNKDGITKDLKFRKAIKYAINRENIEKALNGLFTKSYRYIPNEIKNNVSINCTENLIKGKSFLNSSRYNGEIIKIIYLNDSDNNKRITDCILEDLKSLNLKVESKGVNKEQLKDELNKNIYDIIIKDYKGEYSSQLCYLQKWVSGSKANVYGYKNIKFDNAVLKGKLSGDKTKSNNSYKNAEDILLEDIPTIPLGFYNFILCKKSYVQGIEINDIGNIIIKNSYIQNKK